MPGVSIERRSAPPELAVLWRAECGEYVTALEVSRDGRLCLAGLGDGTLLALDLDSGAERFRVQAHAGGLLGVSACADGAILSCGQDAFARCWSPSGALERELSGGAAWVEHVAAAPQGGRLATASGRRVRIWTSDGEPIVETEALASTVSGLAWRSDGSALAAICYGGVHILPFVPGAKTRQLEWKGSLISIAWSPNGKVVACGSQDCSVHFWRLASGRDSEMQGYPFKPRALAWDRESRLLATGGDVTVTVWDFRGKGPEGMRPIQLEGHHLPCTRLAFSPTSDWLASGSQDTSVLIWRARRQASPLYAAALEDEVTGLAWDPRGMTLVGADSRGTLSAWRW